MVENSGKRKLTEYKRAEKALRASEARYRSLYESSLDGILLTKPDGTIISANPQACKLFGMTEEEIIRAGREGLVVKDEKLVAALEERELTGRAMAELTFKRKDGSTFVGDISSTLFTDADGSIKTSIIIRDITQRKRAEEELRRSQEQYQTLFISVSEGFAHYKAIYDKNGTLCDLLVLEINPAGAKFSGVEREAQVGKTWREVWCNIEDYWFEAYRKVDKTGNSVQCENFSHITNRWYIVKIDRVKKGQFAVTFRDITERKLVEDALLESKTRRKVAEALEVERQRLFNLLDSLPALILLLTSDHHVAFANRSFRERFGESYGRHCYEYCFGNNKPCEFCEAYRVLETGQPHEWEVTLPDESVVHVYNVPFTDVDGSPMILEMDVDVTERKKTEEALKKAHDTLEEKVKERTAELEKAYNSLKEIEICFAEAQKMAHLGNWNRNLGTNKLYWSDELYRIFGLKPQEFEMTYDIFLGFVHPNDRDYVDYSVKNAYNGKPFDIDYRIITVNGEELTVHSQGEVVFDENNNPVRIRGTVQDITERKKAEQRIQSLANIVESSDDSIIAESLDGIITGWNKGAERVYGYSAEEILGKNVSILEPPALTGETKKLTERVKEGQRIQQYETLRLRKDGRIINISTTFSPVFDIYKKLTDISITCRDITQRKEAEKMLAEIDEARIKEIHHRIKNNLQVISSLLDLQAETFSHLDVCETPEVIKAFKESQSRISSMALIHEELYQGKGTDNLDFAIYIQKLAKDLFSSYNLRNKDISLKLDLKQVFLGMDTAIPLGMIVNELVSNSLKHAFPNGRSWEISITLQKTAEFDVNKTGFEVCADCEQERDFQYILTVADNGKGIPEEIEFESSDSLGFQLVNLLVEQIDGCVELESKEGTRFTIWFNDIER